MHIGEILDGFSFLVLHKPLTFEFYLIFELCSHQHNIEGQRDMIHISFLENTLQKSLYKAH